MVKITMPLPFKLPIKEGIKVVRAHEIADLSVTFNNEQHKYRFEGEEEDKLYENTLAVVEYSPNTSLKDEKDASVIFHYAVVNSIQYINRFIDALRFELNIRELANFTITDLPATINIEYNNNIYSYVTNPLKELVNDSEVGNDEIINILNRIATWEKYPHLEVVDKFYDKAKYHLAKEDFIFSIVELQTSFESFIRNSYQLVLLKKGADTKKIEKASNIPFRNVIEQHLAKALKTNLNFNEEGYIKEWYQNLYILRNQIVHSGNWTISGNAAYKAYDSYVNARNYISDLLVIEKFLDPDGKINLKLFDKNIKSSVDSEMVRERLVGKGLLPSGIPVI